MLVIAGDTAHRKPKERRKVARLSSRRGTSRYNMLVSGPMGS